MAVSRALCWIAEEPEILVRVVSRGKERRFVMQDGKAKTIKDQRLAAGSQKYEVGYFAKKHGIKESDARRIIKQHSRDRDGADRVVSRLRG